MNYQSIWFKKKAKKTSFSMALLDLHPKTPSFKSYCSFLTILTWSARFRIFVGLFYLFVSVHFDVIMFSAKRVLPVFLRSCYGHAVVDWTQWIM